jgi:hypothetical protein
MSLGLNKIILANATANTPAAYWQLVTIPATTSGNVVPAGTYIIFGTANVTINAVSAVNATGNVTAVSSVYAQNTGGFIVSDGVSVFVNAASTNTTVTALTVDGGQAAPGTFTS